jgi:membrane protease YdiL (CAAX protease family)
VSESDPNAARGPALLATGAAVAWNNAALPRLDRRLRLGSVGRAAATAAFATVVAAGLRRSASRPVRGDAAWCVAGVGLATVGLVALAPVPAEPVRPAQSWRSRHRRALWLLWEIPVGTAYAEETLFRGALTPALVSAFGPRTGRLIGAGAFGLWHLGPARAARQPVAAVAGVTALAGLALDRLAYQSHSARWGFIIHTMVNQIGAVANDSWRSYKNHR